MQALFTLTGCTRLVLASGSPRRRQFLSEWGVPFDCRPVAGEPDPVDGEPAMSFSARCAAFKLERCPGKEGEVVIAADTVVALRGRIMGKPADAREALDMLRSLAGRDHQVITAVAVALADGETITSTQVCGVHMHAWDDEALAAYVATGECLDKAGAYAIQGVGAFLVDRIDGSWSTVVGLPVSWLANEFVRRGVMAPAR